MANIVYSWSNRVPAYAERLEAMACFGSMPDDDFVAELELAPMEATKPAPVLTPSEALRPFRHGEVAVWN